MSTSASAIRASLALACFAGAIPLAAQAGAPFVPGEILVRPAPGLSDEHLAKVLAKSKGKARRKLRGLEVQVVEVPAGTELEAANALARDRNILFAEPNVLAEPAALVNDPYYSKQWHLPLMGAPAAWDYASGKGITVAICDTGIYAAHPDLAAQVINGWNTVSNNYDTADIFGHGTKVAGIVAAAANNSMGVASMAPAAKILAMRITNNTDGTASWSEMAECVTWAKNNGARIANISYNNVSGSATVASAASTMMAAGGLVVVAAGNDGLDKGYANSPYLFTAAATTSADARADYSNFGSYVDISAPGSSIYTTNSTGTYSSHSGTSYASPNTAGVAALIMSVNPALTPTDVLSIITNTAKDLGSAGWDPYYGFGRVDAGAAVTMAANVATSDRTAPTVAVANPTASTTVKDVVAVDVQATDDFGVSSVDFFVDGVFVATDTQEDPTAPYIYRFAWDSTQVSDGTHELTAKAKDAAGNVGTARNVSVSVANNDDTTPPTFSSRTPASGATVSGVMTMSASATDNVAMGNVTVSGGGVSCSGTTSASCTLNLKKVPVGTTIVVTFTATDAANNRSTEQASVVVGTTTTTTTTTTCIPNPAGKCR